MKENRYLRIGILSVAVLAAGSALAVVLLQEAEIRDSPALNCTNEPVGEPSYREPSSVHPEVSLRKIAGIADPTDAAVRKNDTGIYVSSRVGQVFRLDGTSAPELVLDIGVLDVNSQGGLMSLTFNPEGTHLFVNLTRDGTNYVMAHAIDSNATVDPRGVEILSIQQPRDIHNFGSIVFGPDDHLYVGSGDGGSYTLFPDSRSDGQDTTTVFGAILRIDPDPVGGGYSVPLDSPYVGEDGAAPELWTIGLRHPWRFSFDAATDDLWIGDVGQFCWEEINRISFNDAPGTNFGWSGYEGFAPAFNEPPIEHVLPIHVLPRGEPLDGVVHCAVIGGFVYNGDAMPDLRGAYVYGDWCSGQLETLRLHPDGRVEFQTLLTDVGAVQAFAEDSDGELLILDADAVYRLEPLR